MRKIFLTTLMAVAAVIAIHAQTANNDAAGISWALTTGTMTETPVYAPAGSNQFFEKVEITKGAGLNDPVAKTSDVGNITQTMFPVTSKTSSASDANAVKFLITLRDGIAFTPTKVSFKSFRWKTDKGNFDAAWVSDGTTKTLASVAHPNRGAGTGAGEVSSYSYDLSGTQASEQQFGLAVNIYNFDVAADKGLSLGDVVIEGTLYGTVGQPLTYTLSVNVSPEGAGTVQVSPVGPSYESGQLVTLTQQPAEGYIFTGWQTSTGKTLSTADTYAFNIKGNMALTAKYVTEASLLVNDYAVVSNIDEFRATIKQFNENPSALRRFIFLKNGTYDYGTYKNPESGADPYGRDTIMVDNVSVIGQSTEGVTITITPTMASVSRTAPIVIKGTGTYMQDFTIHNNYNYSGDDGQAATIMDKGHHSIGKNLRLISKQDTYYSNTDNGQLYFETTEFQGTVDYICGRGDVFFNKCRLMCVNRKPKQGDYQGDTHIAAPYTIGENFDDIGGHGYIFMDCYVDCKSKTWDFGRGWRVHPRAAFLNTTLSEDAAKRIGNDQTSGKAADGYAVTKPIDYTLRVGTKGVQSGEPGFEFYEYNTMNEQGDVVSPESNVLTFQGSPSRTAETILKADETDRFQLRNVYPDWQPDKDCKQVVITACELTGNTLSWTTDSKAKAFLIEKDGEFVAIVDGTENSFVVSGSADGYTVRAANMMGGFGIAAPVGTTTGINAPSLNKEGCMAAQKFILNGRIVIEKDGIRYNTLGQQIK